MRNTKLLYIISFLWSLPFWLGIWVVYYLRFTNYAGIGLIEMAAYGFKMVAEIPTGAVADLFGKKKTLLLATILAAVGDILMSQAHSVFELQIAVAFIASGFAFYSGTREALLYDSLVEEKKESLYAFFYGRIQFFELIGYGIAGIVGGFMYTWWIGLPYFMTGMVRLLSIPFLLFIIEPSIGTVTFTVKSYFLQLKQGFSQLFKPSIYMQSLFLLLIGALMMVEYEVVVGAQLPRLGFSTQWLGLLASLLFFGASYGTRLTETITKRFRLLGGALFVAFLAGAVMMLSPISFLYLGFSFLVVRTVLTAISSNIESTVINNNTESQYRATTISTFTMLRSLPYVLSAFGVGILMDKFSPQWFAFGLGLVLCISVPTFYFLNRKSYG